MRGAVQVCLYVLGFRRSAHHSSASSKLELPCGNHDERAEIRDRIRAGESIPSIAESFGRYPSAIRKLLMAT
jgi:hypothetical protein